MLSLGCHLLIQNVFNIVGTVSAVLRGPLDGFQKCMGAVVVFKFEELFDTLEQGLPGKTFSIRPYTDLFSEIIPEERFNAMFRHDCPPLSDPAETTAECHSELEWKNGPGPGYSQDKAEEFISNRHRRAIQPIRRSLQEWNKDRIVQLTFY